jgi:hypothetical protein
MTHDNKKDQPSERPHDHRDRGVSTEQSSKKQPNKTPTGGAATQRQPVTRPTRRSSPIETVRALEGGKML